ncbi:MAG: GNAT family N-acetyltransferase [Alphaproteobacteria bacterium]|nr:GNAT family N-acetyltransferase [Alphaproteobacteria bacterium]
MNGFCYYGLLYVDQLYIVEAYRGQGWGQRLIKAAEDFRVEQRSTMFPRTTMDWEARCFYEKLGYEVTSSFTSYDNFCKLIRLLKRIIS